MAVVLTVGAGVAWAQDLELVDTGYVVRDGVEGIEMRFEGSVRWLRRLDNALRDDFLLDVCNQLAPQVIPHVQSQVDIVPTFMGLRVTSGGLIGMYLYTEFDLLDGICVAGDT